MSTSQLAYLDELIARDEAAARTLRELDELMRAVAALRARVELVSLELEQGPALVARCAAEEQAACEGLEAARGRLDDATVEEQNARASDDPEALRAATHEVVQAKDSVRIAERRAASADARLSERREQLAEAERDRPEVEQQARELAASLSGRPRLPANVSDAPATFDDVRAWAVEVRAAMAVARSAVANEREQSIRQACELGAFVTGSPVSASSMQTLATVIRAATPS